MVLPKAESPADLDRVRDGVGADMPVLPIIETARGLDAVAALLGHPVSIKFSYFKACFIYLNGLIHLKPRRLRI